MAISTPSNTDCCDGGYDYQFVETPTDLVICNICHLPSRNPYISACCGHIFCKSCLEAAKKSTTVITACPVCRSEEYVAIPNKQIDRLVRSLHVFCSNKEKGCKWQSEVNDVINHLNDANGCQFQDVNCFNDCGEILQRQYLLIHLKTVSTPCDYLPILP